jgi:uncharacterized protein (DUF952 family)
MLVFKLLTPDEMAAFNLEQEVPLSAADRADGYVHLSTGTQVAETAGKHFAGAQALWLLAVEAERLGRGLRWEEARDGDHFPHFYGGRLAARQIVWSRPLARGTDGRFRFPEEIGP